MGDAPKVEFVLGSEVSPGHFFKSSFARSFVTNCRDSKSLDYEFADNNTIVEEADSKGDCRNNNFFSLVNFANGVIGNNHTINKHDSSCWKRSEMDQPSTDIGEVEKLRKQCQSLTEENRRLQNVLTSNQVPHVQMIDSVLLQTQVDTLQWQVKQAEANKQMYRSLMEQVVRFLDRARKSLDILHEKNNSKDKSLTGRVPRSRSVHTVHGDSSPSRGTSTSSSSSSGSSRFTRAKSVTQISPCTTGLREFTWSVLRRNDPVHCTPPRTKVPQDLNKTHDGVVYRRPKQVKELDPDDIPPEKLSQEAFRLMRTVQSLLAMREPDLARVTPIEDSGSSPSPVDHHQEALSLQNGSFVNSTILQEGTSYVGCSRNDRGNESSTESDTRACFLKSPPGGIEVDRNLQNLLPGIRRSLDATSLNSGSSKTTEEEDILPGIGTLNVSLPGHDSPFTTAPTSTPIKYARKTEKKDTGRSSKSKPAASISSAEDESGFSSMSSFQEVGLPTTLPISPIKGCHAEVGLPEIPLEKARHRRWSSTPTEIQGLFKQHRASFTTSQTTTESLSVWV